MYTRERESKDLDVAPYGCWVPLVAELIQYTQVRACVYVCFSSQGTDARTHTNHPENPLSDSHRALWIHGLAIVKRAHACRTDLHIPNARA